MASSKKLASVVGARPQFVKLAPMVQAIGECAGLEHQIVHTGQHYDDRMSASFFEQLELPRPDVDLGVGSGTHGEQTAAMLIRLEDYFLESKPDAVIVYGDTNSTLAAALAASKMQIQIAHIESGLRSFRRSMPEEVNRLVADHCGDRLYAPTAQAMQNLQTEGLSDRSVLSGDVMLDAIRLNAGLAQEKSTALVDLELESGRFGLVTVHRPVNTTVDALERLLAVLEATVDQHLPLVFPVHPRTRAALDEMSYEPPSGLRLLGPLPYLDIIVLIQAAALVITDSGGVVKEAAFLQTPCLTIRDETEWPETVAIGVNRLVGDNGTNLLAGIEAILSSPDIFDERALALIKKNYGDGNAASLIAGDLRQWLS